MALRYPRLDQGPVRAEVFTPKEQFETEREPIFKNFWLNAGRLEQAKPVDNVVQDSDIGRTLRPATPIPMPMRATLDSSIVMGGRRYSATWIFGRVLLPGVPFSVAVFSAPRF